MLETAFQFDAPWLGKVFKCYEWLDENYIAHSFPSYRLNCERGDWNWTVFLVPTRAPSTWEQSCNITRYNKNEALENFAGQRALKWLFRTVVVGIFLYFSVLPVFLFDQPQGVARFLRAYPVSVSYINSYIIMNAHYWPSGERLKK